MSHSLLPSYAELCQHANTPIEVGVLGTESFNGLAVMRSLGRRGVPVTAFSSDAKAIGFASRYATRRITHPGPADDPTGFIRAVKEAGEESQKRKARLVVIPTSDRQIELLAAHEAELARAVDLYLPTPACLASCLDKMAQYRLSEEIGVPYPRTYSDAEESRLFADLDAGRIAPPFICKARGNLPDESLTLRFRRLPLADRSSLEKHLEAAQKHGIRYVVQEIIPGGDDELYTLGVSMDRKGQVLAAFTGRKLRQMPPGYGICRVGECREVPEVRELGVRLLRALSFNGIAQVEFKRDHRDGRYCLMEVNPRSWAWIGLPLALGCEIVYSQVCATLGFPLGENDTLPATKALWISLANDLEWSLAVRDAKPWTPLLGGYDRIVEAHFAVDDPKPGLRHTSQFLGDYASRGWTKLWRKS